MPKLKLLAPNGKEYIPLPTQAKAHADPRRYILYSGGFGSGKTVWAITTCIQLCLQYPNNFIVIVRETVPALKSSTIMQVEAWMPPGVAEYNKTDMMWTFLNGSRLKFMSADNPESVRSMEIGGYFLEEANRIPKEMHTQISGRLRNPYVPAHSYRGMYTTNPTSKNHWLYKLFTQEGPKDLFAFYNAPSTENKDNLPEGYIESISAGMTDEQINMFVQGNFSPEFKGARVYSDFVNKVHVKANLKKHYNPFLPIIRGWDFGYHKPACVWVQIGQDGDVNILHEMLGNNIFLKDFATQCLMESFKLFPECKQWADVCDPAGAQMKDTGETSTEQLAQVLGHYPRYRTDNRSIEFGVGVIREYMKRMVGGMPMFKIDAECENLIEGFMGGYHYGEVHTDIIEKDGYYDHLQDAFRYIIVNLNNTYVTKDMKRFLDRQALYVPRNGFTGY